MHPVARPAGYAFLTLIALLVYGVLFGTIWPGYSLLGFAAAFGGVGVSTLLLAAACSRFGFIYRLTSTDERPVSAKAVRDPTQAD